MDDELIDIVDEGGVILGQISKIKAHEKGLLHRCVLAQLIN